MNNCSLTNLAKSYSNNSKMDLVNDLFNCLNEFTNPNNGIREEAEKKFNSIIEQSSSDQIISSLLVIINNCLTKTVSFSALIRLFKLVQDLMLNQSISAESIINLRNTILQFYVDPRFPPEMHNYISEIILNFYLFSLYPKNQPFNEIWPFLDNLLQKPDFYADALFFYTNILTRERQQNNFNFYDEQKIQYIFSHLNSSYSQRDRSRTLIFFMRFNHIYSGIIPPIDYVLFLNDFDEIFFKESISMLIGVYMDQKIAINAASLYNIMYSRIIDENNSELFRQYLLFHLCNVICYIKDMNNCFISNLPQFIHMLTLVSADPYKFPILYEEAKVSLSSLICNLENVTPLLMALSKTIEATNDYTSSLFLRFTILSTHYERGIAYAMHPDEYIRANGLIYIRRLVKYQNNDLCLPNQAMNNIATCLINSYNQYADPKILKALSVWCAFAQPDTLSNFFEPIFELSTNIISFEAIECGATLLTLDSIKEQRSNFALSLLNRIHDLLSSNSQNQLNSSLSNLMNFLPKITRSVSEEQRFNFMVFFINHIIDDEDCLFTKGMTLLCHQFSVENFNKFEDKIISKLFMIYNHSLQTADSTALSNFLEAIPNYCFCFSDFEEKYLQFFMKICINIIKEKNTFSVDQIPNASRGISKAIRYYEQNEDLFNLFFEISFKFVSKDDEIYELSSYLKIIKSLTKSEYFTSKKALITLNYLKPLLDHATKIIVNMKQSGTMIDKFDSIFISKIVTRFIYIYYELCDRCPSESFQLIIANFLNFDDYPIEIKYIIVDFYFKVLNDFCNQFESDIAQKMIHNLFGILAKMPLQQEQLDQLQNEQFVDGNIRYFFQIQQETISGFGNLFYEKQMNDQVIDKLIEYVSRILNFQNQSNNDLHFLQNRCFGCLVKLILRYKLNIEDNIPEKIALIGLTFQWMPNCYSIDNLAFICIFEILLFCISSNIFDGNSISSFIDLTCKSVRDKKVQDRALRGIKQKYTNLPEMISPLLVEITNFLE